MGQNDRSQKSAKMMAVTGKSGLMTHQDSTYKNVAMMSFTGKPSGRHSKMTSVNVSSTLTAQNYDITGSAMFIASPVSFINKFTWIYVGIAYI